MHESDSSTFFTLLLLRLAGVNVVVHLAGGAIVSGVVTACHLCSDAFTLSDTRGAMTTMTLVHSDNVVAVQLPPNHTI